MSMPGEAKFLLWWSARLGSALSSLPGVSPGAGDSLILKGQRGSGLRAGDREHWAGAVAGMCKVPSVQQHMLRVVLGICNSQQDP